MIIDAFLTPFFPETEKQFDDAIVIMIDVLRSGTTISAALFNGAKEIISSESHDKAVRIYSSLSKESRFLGGETNGLKPGGFDAGNSPFEYKPELVKGKTVIISTTNGTKIYLKARQAKLKVVGGFVNNHVIMDFIKKNQLDTEEKVSSAKIMFLCAGTNGRLSYEDTLCAGLFIHSLTKLYPGTTLTDSADASKNLYKLHSKDLLNFLKNREHALLLSKHGFDEDIHVSLSYDIYPVVPIILGNTIKKFEENDLIK